VAAQELLESPRFPSKAFFRQRFTAPLPPKVELQAPTKLSDFVVGDKLELSLKQYLELVLVNNTEIQIQKLSLEQPRNAITAAFAPFDPSVSVSFASTRSNRQTNDVLAGAAVASTLSQPLNFNFQQRLETGTIYTIGFNGQKQTSNSAFNNFNPAINTGLRMGFTQPLLRDRGGYVNRLNVMVARSRYRQQEYTLSDTLMRLLQVAENAYWSVVEARESLKVQEDGLKVQEVSLNRSEQELKLGAISELEIYRPRQSYATQEVSVTRARYQLQQVEDQLRRQIGADLDPQFQNMPLVLTETAQPPTDDTPLDKEKFVESAYQNRPDLKATTQSLDIDDLNYRQAKNSLLPSLSLEGAYDASGRGGRLLQRSNVFTGDGTASQVTSVIPGGLGDALNQLFSFNYPTYAMTLRLQLPLRDRAASASLANAIVSKKQNALRVRNTQQLIRQDVLNAITQVESARASVKLAQKALEFARLNEEAEQKRFDLGVTQLFFLLDAQNAKVAAEASLVQSTVGYHRQQLNLLRVTGQLLDARGVTVQ
jgi:HAE1 family hydrophobic/amphiphilic exporter-1